MTSSKVPRESALGQRVCSLPWWVRRGLWADDGVSSGIGGPDCSVAWQRAERVLALG